MAYELIETITLTSSASSIEFTSIPQDGVDLVLVASVRASASNDYAYVKINGDNTDTNYPRRALRGTGSAASSFGGSFFPALASPKSTDTANTFGNGQLYFPNYTSSANKTISADHVGENNGSAAYQQLQANIWTNTSAITSLTIEFSTDDLVAGSTASLYKIS